VPLQSVGAWLPLSTYLVARATRSVVSRRGSKLSEHPFVEI